MLLESISSDLVIKSGMYVAGQVACAFQSRFDLIPHSTGAV